MLGSHHNQNFTQSSRGNQKIVQINNNGGGIDNFYKVNQNYNSNLNDQNNQNEQSESNNLPTQDDLNNYVMDTVPNMTQRIEKLEKGVNYLYTNSLQHCLDEINALKQEQKRTTFKDFRSKLYDYLSKDDFKNSENLVRRGLILIIPLVLIPLFMRNWENKCLRNITNAFSDLFDLSKEIDIKVDKKQAVKNLKEERENIIDLCHLGTLLLSGFSFFVGFHWW